jgi:LmbE family N-acetylglucosaminyl deacetylase
MAANIAYTRRTPESLLVTSNIAELLDDWRPNAERWMFVSAHDDDVTCGAALSLQAGLAEGAQVHVVVATDGRMGYCRPEHRQTIAEIRRAETEKSYRILGLPPDRLRFLGFPDCNVSLHRGRRLAAPGELGEIAGATGLQNGFTHALRQIRPNRLFLPTSADLHPDHRIVHEETLISLFHAQGSIWPELGEPIAEVPRVYEFACYCDFPELPQIRIETPVAMFEAKLAAIATFASQEQIGALVELQRQGGPVEYLRQLDFHFYAPQNYHSLFAPR